MDYIPEYSTDKNTINDPVPFETFQYFLLDRVYQTEKWGGFVVYADSEQFGQLGRGSTLSDDDFNFAGLVLLHDSHPNVAC